MKLSNQDGIGQCNCCGKHDEDVMLCSQQGCMTELHPKCGAQCEACGALLCEEHGVEIDGLRICLLCAPEALLESIAQNTSHDYLTKTSSAA